MVEAKNKNKYDYGIIIGRFQMFHTGHQDMINTALRICNKVAVYIGSSQESGTNNNPFSFELRKEIIKTIFKNRVEVNPLPDIGVGNNNLWGDYVLTIIKETMPSNDYIFISGKENRRYDWLTSEKGLRIPELYIPKTVDISGTKMRDMLLNNEFELWKKYTDSSIWNRFDELKVIIEASHNNTITDSI